MPDIYPKDGYIVTDFSNDAPKWIQKLPSYGKWTKFLLARGYAQVTGQFTGEDGKPVDILKPLEHAVAKVDPDTGHTLIPCLCCGVMIDQDDPFVRRHTGLVSVGGLVKVKETTVTGPKTMMIRIVPKPVSKRGTGCKACQGRMLAAIEDISAVNKQRLKQARLLADMAQIEGQILRLQGVKEKEIQKQIKKRLPEPLQARIDIFSEVEADL